MRDPGAIALELLDDRAIVTPPLGAGWWSVTVPVTESPPIIDAGDSVMLCRSGASIISVAVFADPPCLAAIVTVTSESTSLVVTVKVADEAPGATVIVCGADASELPLDIFLPWER